MKKLELNQMENLEGGLTKNCVKALVSAGIGVAGLITSIAGGPFTIGIGFAGFLFSIGDNMGACSGQI